jgi:hypothetical protein
VDASGWEDEPTVGLGILPCPNRLQLQALHFQACYTPLLHWLMQHESCYRMLRILKVWWVKAASVQFFAQFLRAIGSILESLTVEVGDREPSL